MYSSTLDAANDGVLPTFEHDLAQRLVIGQHRDHDFAPTCCTGWRVRYTRARFSQRLRLFARTVVNDNVVSRTD